MFKLKNTIAGTKVALLLFTIPLNTQAELTDVTQAPNALNFGIQKSLEEQIGADRGNINTPDSSLFLIKRDPYRSIRRGRQIFQRKFTKLQGLGPRANDGIGNIGDNIAIGAGLTDSCAACHGRPRGSAGFGGDVATRPDSRDAPHLFGLGLVEMLGDEITTDLRKLQDNAINRATRKGFSIRLKLKSKGINYGYITGFPDGSVDTSEVYGVSQDLRIKPFFHQGGVFSIREFVVGAFRDEMGLQAHDPDLTAASNGADITTPAGMVLSGTIDSIHAPPAYSPHDDPDQDSIFNEIPTSLIDHMEFYLLNYFRAGTYKQTPKVEKGKKQFARAKCTNCHIPNLKILKDRRVADVKATYRPKKGNAFNPLFATASVQILEYDDNTGYPTQKLPKAEPFIVRGIYADFRRHDLGPNFWERKYDGSLQKYFMTEPLWGVGSTSPYGHDGRSINLHEVILRHGGEAESSRNNYAKMSNNAQSQILEFLKSLVLYPPDDTASNLNPANPSAPNYPQYGHGSINLGALFNDTTDPE